MALLNVIQEKRSILFGKISEVDNKQRHLGWMEVLSSAQSLQIVSAERDFAFVRDKIWGVWKSRAMVILSILIISECVHKLCNIVLGYVHILDTSSF